MPGKTKELFDGTVPYYAKYRPPYPAKLIDLISGEIGDPETRNILDLGCGTGHIAIPLSRRGYVAHAVDPNVDMLHTGINAEQEQGGSGIHWMVGSDTGLERLNLPSLNACVMAASFHWTQRSDLLSKLDGMIAEQGCVIVVSGGTSVWSDEQAPWKEICRSTITRFLGTERRAGNGTYEHPAKRHEEIFKASSFSVFKNITISHSHELSVDEIIGLQLSTSYASPNLLGNSTGAFMEALKEHLLRLNPAGNFIEDIKYQLIVARRK